LHGTPPNGNIHRFEFSLEANVKKLGLKTGYTIFGEFRHFLKANTAK
jgi:hypothetical protein